MIGARQKTNRDGEGIMFRSLAIAMTVVALGTGCAHKMIQGTQVPATDDNLAVMAVLVELQEAMRAKSTDRILSLVSTAYFEDNGTPDPRDDYGFEQLKTEILPKSLDVAEEIFVSFQVHDITVDDETAQADIRYNSRARLNLPTGTLWDTHREFNRVIFALEDGAWHIVSGL
ncbi:MAG: hypothetical protein A2289_08150 [Deltaproteobacteria bacterium RIFOXYA12_FULL_58_15]|nr:MAG: hypothetical protein A2289_08150 [Deltaproteobacteria bacterium RIFOXYA12_FULL_58_15]OGR09478.1 MAG: hypothetical protein A2341_01615 [Deltaproteobacteria bacterium RIFOXYB12_FULL_58_9]